jgi:uncharacterized membrane protein SpoIIM required for sporulation
MGVLSMAISRTGPRPPREPESNSEKYARQTRTAAVFVAWCVAIVMVLSLVGVIITANVMNKVANDLTGGSGGSTPTCQSQGGTLPC